ncbi:helix-turn-helix transcriptional regulator [Faecousia sp. CLA-AA-H192]|jgi:putative transcriptional regulator|uniref:Helix-turn-helix transcriptional regulator n=1 Tax=Faecousia intestinalis TaxID=3133167 RepID=A0ABV1G609_9FIRM
MAVRYNKLWKILIDKKMKKKDLQEAAHITHYQMMKLARDENITTEIIGRICKALGCTPDEIMEFYDE